MSTSQQRKADIITRLVSRQITTAEAALLLGLTPRQVRRSRRRFTTEGVSSVVHGNTRRQPANRTSASLIERLRLLAGTGGKYADFNVAHLTEVLERDERICLPRSTQRAPAARRRHPAARCPATPGEAVAA